MAASGIKSNAAVLLSVHAKLADTRRSNGSFVVTVFIFFPFLRLFEKLVNVGLSTTAESLEILMFFTCMVTKKFDGLRKQRM